MKVIAFGPAAGWNVAPEGFAALRTSQTVLAHRESYVRYDTSRPGLLEDDFQAMAMVSLWLPPNDADPVVRLKDLHETLEAGVTCLVDEHVIVDGEPKAQSVRMVGLICRAGGLDTSAFAEHWVGRHAPITLGYRPAFVRYVANVVRATVGVSYWDGIVEQWFPDGASLAQHIRLATDGGRPRIAGDIPRFVAEMQMFATGPGAST